MLPMPIPKWLTAGLEAGAPNHLKRLDLQANNAKPQPCGGFSSPRQLCLIGFLFFALSVRAGGDPTPPGYLAVVGPSALRFAAMPRPFTNLFILLPPAPVIPPAPTNAPPAVTNSDDSELPPQPQVTVTPPVPVMVTNQVIVVPPPDTGVPVNVISPQMFLKYFSKGTNGGASSTIIAPLDFTPPRSTPPPSSATYSTSPP